MKYQERRFTVPASAGKPETCAKVGHTEPNQRGKCLRCGAKVLPIAFELTGETYKLATREGTVHVAKLTAPTTRTALQTLVGQVLSIGRVLGVESYAIEQLRAGVHIGLLVR